MAKRGGATVPSKQKIYTKIAMRSDEIVDEIFELTKSKNESIKLGALKLLLNKILPDLKTSEPPEFKEEKKHEIGPGLKSWLKDFAEKRTREENRLITEAYEKETGKKVSKILEKHTKRG